MDMNKRSGFTLVEIVVVLGIIAVLAGAITPMAFQVVSARREQATREELKAIKEAIIGKAKEAEYGEEFTFGFVGDIGNIPTTLDQLTTIGTLTVTIFSTIEKMSAGWNGPYIMEGSGDSLEDPFGTEYTYTVGTGTNSAGVEYLATITSAGRDGISGNSDDLSIELLKREVYADVIGYVKDLRGVGVAFIDVTINYPKNGGKSKSIETTDANGLYEFSDIPIGDHTTTISPRLLYRHGTAKTTTESRNKVRFEIENFYENAIVISTMKVENKFFKDAYYEDITIGTETVYTYSSTRPGDDTLTTISSVPPVTISASTMSSEPFLTRVQAGGRVEAPDIVVSRIAAGGSLTIEIGGYKAHATTTNPDDVDMTGIPFKVTFNGLYEVSFIPSGVF